MLATSASDLWPALLSLTHIAAAAAVTVDAVLRKRHVPSIIGWVGLAWLAPIVGSLLYLLFGINRIHRTAVAQELKAAWDGSSELGVEQRQALRGDALAAFAPAFAGLARLGECITGSPLLRGNRIEPLENGDEAFPAMLAAIDGAQRSVALLTYIFDSDRAGEAFLQALVRARERGVQVRVLIDDVGSRYTRPTMLRRLRRAGIGAEAFLRTHLPRLFRYANLRNHRKILVVDGAIGFTGGMNVRESHWLACAPPVAAHCLHFRVTGPVVADLQRTFAVDWAFTTGEHLGGEDWFPPLEACDAAVARGVPDGPDADLDNIPHLLLGALSVAMHTVKIVTPYFLPDGVLLRALQVAAMRGVEVDIVLPSRSNVPIMDWAMAPQLPALLDKGCRIHSTPPPFDHTKLLVVDGFWSLIGSTNWDARSLRLNFEYNLECYDAPLARRLEALVEQKIARSARLDADVLRARPFAIRLRNGLARLLSPYL
jgi:cardiolipin synthase A/B